MRLNDFVTKSLLFATAASLSASVYSAVITNADVIKLLEAGMTEDVIIQAIVNGEGKFDTSANALIRLKTKGATPAVLKAILSPAAVPASRGAATAATAPPVAASASSPVSTELKLEDVLLISEDQETALQYVVPNIRSAARAFGFGGFATYAGLNGPMAQLRLKSSNLEFVVPVPKNAQPTSYVTLANFVIRSDGTREVSVASGVVSFTAKIPSDRVVPTTVERLPDQSRAKDGLVLYRVTTTQAIKPGEFALVLVAPESQAGGWGTGPNPIYRFFDFGID